MSENVVVSWFCPTKTWSRITKQRAPVSTSCSNVSSANEAVTLCGINRVCLGRQSQTSTSNLRSQAAYIQRPCQQQQQHQQQHQQRVDLSSLKMRYSRMIFDSQDYSGGFSRPQSSTVDSLTDKYSIYTPTISMSSSTTPRGFSGVFLSSSSSAAPSSSSQRHTSRHTTDSADQNPTLLVLSVLRGYIYIIYF